MYSTGTDTKCRRLNIILELPSNFSNDFGVDRLGLFCQQRCHPCEVPQKEVSEISKRDNAPLLRPKFTMMLRREIYILITPWKKSRRGKIMITRILHHFEIRYILTHNVALVRPTTPFLGVNWRLITMIWSPDMDISSYLMFFVISWEIFL